MRDYYGCFAVLKYWGVAELLDFPKGNVICEARHMLRCLPTFAQSLQIAWGGIYDCLREDQQSTFTFMWKANCLCRWLTLLIWGIDDHLWDDQHCQSWGVVDWQLPLRQLPQRQSPLRQSTLLILVGINDCLLGDQHCWCSLRWSSTPPASTEAIAFSHKSASWLLMVYNMWHSLCWKVLVDSDLHIYLCILRLIWFINVTRWYLGHPKVTY